MGLWQYTILGKKTTSLLHKINSLWTKIQMPYGISSGLVKEKAIKVKVWLV
jgi:hypothetical protein